MTDGVIPAEQVNSGPSTGGALARIRSRLNQAAAADARIAGYVLEHPLEVTAMSVTQLAAAVGVATSTVVRACQRFGFAGFQDLKFAVARDAAAGRPRLTPAGVAGGLPGVLPAVAAAATAALEDTLQTVDADALARLCRHLLDSVHVLVVGAGPSAATALDAAYRLRSVGVAAVAPMDVMTQEIIAGGLRRGDLLLVISHTGAARESVCAVGKARAGGAVTAAVTSFATSPLTEAVDLALIAGSADVSYRAQATAGRFAHMAVIDALCCGITVLAPERAGAAYAERTQALSQHQS